MTKEIILAIPEIDVCEFEAFLNDYCDGSETTLQHYDIYEEAGQKALRSARDQGRMDALAQGIQVTPSKKQIEEAEQRGYAKGFAETKTHVLSKGQIEEAVRKGKIEVLREMSLKDVTGDYVYNGDKYVRGQLVRLFDILEKIQQLEKEG